MTLDQIIQDLKINTIDNSEDIFFSFIINKLKSVDQYDFYTNNEKELKNILIFVGRKYSRMIEVRNSVIEHKEHGREFCFTKTHQFDKELKKYILNKKIKKVKC